jgi:hypothetical protein
MGCDSYKVTHILLNYTASHPQGNELTDYVALHLRKKTEIFTVTAVSTSSPIT